MTYDHESARLHRAELDREIESIQIERLLAAERAPRPGVLDRARRRAGNALIAAGRSLAGPDRQTMRTHRA